MTAADFANYVRIKTKTNSNTFEDADILLLMKLRQDELARAVLKVDEDIFLSPHEDDLVENQREYPFDPDILSRIKRVEAKLDGSEWIKLIGITQDRINVTHDEDTIVDNFTNTQGGAYYVTQRKAIYIYSGTVIDVSEGLKVWIKTYPAIVTDLSESSTDLSVDPSTTTHGMPRELHEIWARGVIIDYKESKEKPIPLSERELKYEVDKQKAIESLMHQDLDREVIGDLPDSSERGNEGYEY